MRKLLIVALGLAFSQACFSASNAVEFGNEPITMAPVDPWQQGRPAFVKFNVKDGDWQMTLTSIDEYGSVVFHNAGTVVWSPNMIWYGSPGEQCRNVWIISYVGNTPVYIPMYAIPGGVCPQ